MASTGKCEFCGSTLLSSERTCSQCGASNANYVEDTPRTVFLPKTIDELKEYCAERGMPLARMRFFIDEDFREPRAFGIYRDGDTFVVYKNKSDGSRSVRYHGPDEAYAVGELFHKLLEECHNRGIYPDGKPASSSSPGGKKGGKKKHGLIRPVVIALLLALAAIAASGLNHRQDGYYRILKEQMYYRYGPDWYVEEALGDWRKTSGSDFSGDYVYLGDEYDSQWGDYTDFRESALWEGLPAEDMRAKIQHRDDGYYLCDTARTYYRYGSDWYYQSYPSTWVESDFPESDYGEYYEGGDFESDWGGADFKQSAAWREIEESHSSSSSDYDSWDWGDTDWDSDW